MRLFLKKLMEGRMGTNLTPVWGVLVGFAKRKWLAEAIGQAIISGHIPADGDTTTRLAQWAAANDRALFERIERSGE